MTFGMYMYGMMGVGLATLAGYFFLEHFLMRRGYDLSGSLKSFSGGLGLLLIPVSLGVMTYIEVADYLELKNYGVSATAVVVESHQEVRRSRRRISASHINLVEYAGHKKRLALEREHPTGTGLQIVYSSRKPDVTRIGQLPASVSDVVFGGASPLVIVIVFALLIACLVGSFFCFRDGILSFRISGKA